MSITITIETNTKRIVATRSTKTVDPRDPTEMITWKSNRFDLSEVWGELTGTWNGERVARPSPDVLDWDVYYAVRDLFEGLEQIANAMNYLD